MTAALQPERQDSHPPITARTCPDCGAAYEARYAKRCRGCRYKPANIRGSRPPKYVWTPERDAFLVKHYDGNTKGRAAQIARTFGWPRWVINKRAGQLALTRPIERQDWTEDEVSFLHQHLGARTAAWIAKRLSRSEAAVAMKIKRLGLCRRVDDGTYSARQVAAGFGIDGHVVDAWIRSGLLKATRDMQQERATWRVHPEDVAVFIRSNPMAFDIRKVDQVWFLDVLGVIVGEVRA